MTVHLSSPPRPTPPPTLDASQRAALATAIGTDNVVVLGPPGSGKTTVALAIVSALVDGGIDPSRVLLLCATRAAAARLRDEVAAAVGRATGAPMVRTPASAAFSVLRSRAALDGLPSPTLVTGAEQDVVLGELLAGHASGVVPGPDWGGVVPGDATALPGFRAELRDLIMRAAESGLEPDDLAALGRRTDRQEWIAAAHVMREYRDVMALRAGPADQGARHDPASVVADAAWEVSRAPHVDRPAWEVIVADDYHESTAATREFLTALDRSGARIVVLGNADQAVQTHRGANPFHLTMATLERAEGGFAAVRVDLDGAHRQDPSLERVSRAIADRIGHLPGASSRRRPSVADEGEVPLRLIAATHRHAQSRAIAAALRQARHGFAGPGMHWSDMAVLARSTAVLREIRADLIAADIPCESLGDGVALHAQPAVSPLLAIAELAAGDPWSESIAVDLLTSRLCGVDGLGVRRLRRALVVREREASGERLSSALLVEAMGKPDTWSGLSSPEAFAAARLARAVSRARAVATSTSATPAAVLWAAWDGLGLANLWRDAALAGSEQDDADLDAVVALFRAAQQFSERLPEAGIRQFVAHLNAQDFAVDSLAARGVRGDAVTFATPASAAGRTWELVAIAGLEEGAWPNTRLRDSVLGAGHLADIVSGRAAPEPVTVAWRTEAVARSRASVVDDETRAMLVALTRARSEVVVTWVAGEDARPSRYVGWLAAAAAVPVSPVPEDVADLRGAVAQLRRRAVAATGAERAALVASLAQAANANLEGANPDAWHGVPEPSSAVGMYRDMPVRVSPSKVETLERCALRWALEASGGRRAASAEQNLGMLIHEIAAASPRGNEQELLAELDARWSHAPGEQTWRQRREYQDAREMVRTLARYFESRRGFQLLVEQPFAVDLGRARLAGQADRIEVSDDGTRIVDLKTGTVVSQADAAAHAQLAMYQLAAINGGFASVSSVDDAALVFVGKGSGQRGSTRVQPRIDDDETLSRLDNAVDVMTASTFIATSNDGCDSCPVRRSCPVHASGREVSGG